MRESNVVMHLSIACGEAIILDINKFNETENKIKL